MDNHTDPSMAWMMLICCALPIVALLFFGGALSSLRWDGYLVPILAGALVVIFAVKMARGRGNHDAGQGSDASPVQPQKTGDEHTHGGCCH